MAMTRRKFLQAAAIAGTASLGSLYLLRTAHGSYRYAPEDFIYPLIIPPEYHGRTEKGRRIFDLSLQHGTSEFFKGYDTPTIGINSDYLGPVLRLHRGEFAEFNVKNNLNMPSTLHWHGVYLPALMDGGPHQEIAQGKVWKASYEIRQPASTLWYHAHTHRYTGPQVYQGLAGLFYVDDEYSQQADIPKTYGIDDIPLVLQDRNFHQDGSFRYVSNMHERMAGMRGNFILVNGTIRPLYRAQRRQTRFRILNGSNARIYNLHFSDNREFTQIASDGGFMPTPVRMKHLRLAPGERAEIIVEFGAKDDVMLQHKPLPTSNFGMGMGMMAMMMSGDDQPFNIMRFVSKNPGGEISTWQGVKHEQHDLNPANIVNTRTFGLDMAMGMGMMMNRMSGAGSGMTINNKSFDMNRIDEVVRLNDTEVWEFTNNSPLPHPMHIHDIQFRVLSRNNGPAELNENGLKDTVLVNPDETVRVITRFEHYTDERFPYMFHCHILEHEDQGMMGQFVVV